MNNSPGSNRETRREGTSAFTLVEMLLVLVILGVLAAIVYPKIAEIGREARVKSTKAQIASLRTAFAMFEMDHGFFPPGQDGIFKLADPTRDIPDSHAPYIEKLPKDGWDRAFVYECPGRHNAASYDLMSSGPDGHPDTEDDITNWEASQ